MILPESRSKWQPESGPMSMTIDLPLAVGLVSLALAIVLWLTWGQEVSRQATLLQGQISVAQAASRTHSEPVSQRADAELGKKADINWSRLPKRSEVPDLVVEISRLATLAKVDVQTLNVTYAAGTPKRAERVELAIQAKGSYPALRAFLTMASNSVASLSVNRLQMTRNDETGKSIDAVVSLFIWTRDP